MGTSVLKTKEGNSRSGLIWSVPEFRVAIVDDIYECRENITNIAKLLTGDKIDIHQYDSGEAFLEDDQVYDLVLLDIEMTGKDGFDTAIEYKRRYSSVLIAFVTTHTEYWKKGYIVNAFRFIEKGNLSADMEELFAACNQIFSKMDTISFKARKYKSVKIRIDTIIYIETDRPYISIHTKQGIIHCYENMKEALCKLEKYGFIQCHRGYIVNLREVRDYNDEVVRLMNGESVLLSSKIRKDFVARYIKFKFEIANQ